jgi:endonuclease YncB( thermonuclease family)
MSQVKLFWDPAGFELDALGSKEYLRSADGDTPYVSMAIRMLSVDTPEVSYPGGQNPATQDSRLRQLADWIKAGKTPIQDGLAGYLHPRLASGKAGTLQGEQGKQASDFFQQLIQTRLTRDNGSKRTLFLHTSNQPFDDYGRLLAYIAPTYSAEELAGMTRRERATFNLLMVESGWAASFLIYPSLPTYPDLVLFYDAARTACEAKKGVWGEPLTLTGYEYRMAVKLWEITKKLNKGQKLSTGERFAWISRYAADLSNNQIYYPQDYYRIAPYNRLFIWPRDVNEAVGRLNLMCQGDGSRDTNSLSKL